jgi:hypothetical protein
MFPFRCPSVEFSDLLNSRDEGDLGNGIFYIFYVGAFSVRFNAVMTVLAMQRQYLPILNLTNPAKILWHLKIKTHEKLSLGGGILGGSAVGGGGGGAAYCAFCPWL